MLLLSLLLSRMLPVSLLLLVAMPMLLSVWKLPAWGVVIVMAAGGVLLGA